VSPVRRSPAANGILKIEAPSREAADALVRQLEHCDCLVIQRAPEEWIVRAQPWRQDARSLRDALSAIEAWIVASGSRTTTVALGERTFTLAADGNR
jgi:hypothetical protein